MRRSATCGACVQADRARADQFLGIAPLDDSDVDARQRQFACQHQPRRTAPDDHHRVSQSVCRQHHIHPRHSRFPLAWAAVYG
jgi:hypothetical protein